MEHQQHKEPREVHMFVDLLLHEVTIKLSFFPCIFVARVQGLSERGLISQSINQSPMGDTGFYELIDSIVGIG